MLSAEERGDQMLTNRNPRMRYLWQPELAQWGVGVTPGTSTDSQRAAEPSAAASQGSVAVSMHSSSIA